MPAPKRISLSPHVADQQNILFYGRRVGYCGTLPGMPITFLTDSKGQCGLTAEEKTEVIAFVIGELGHVKQTHQTKPYWPKSTEVVYERERQGVDD